MNVVHPILELARWAPSGDNTQPWRFVLRSDNEFDVHGYDTRAHCVYDLDGSASQFAHGALLETIAIAATRFGFRADAAIVSESPSGHIVYRVQLTPGANGTESPLAAAITERTVQRRPMSTRPLSTEQKRALELAATPFRVAWIEGPAGRRQMAALNAFSAHIRLTIPEAFAVHKATIEWNVATSEDRMPSSSLGAPFFLEPVMRSAMGSWERVRFLNRYLGGTILPRLFLDWLPGQRCSAHFALIGPAPAKRVGDFVAAGRATQRFWLAATGLGLQMQPLYTPLVFARYAREGRNFTVVESATARAKAVSARLEGILGTEAAQQAVFLGRIGPRRAVKGRSLRLPLERLLVAAAPDCL